MEGTKQDMKKKRDKERHKHLAFRVLETSSSYDRPTWIK